MDFKMEDACYNLHKQKRRGTKAATDTKMGSSMLDSSP